MTSTSFVDRILAVNDINNPSLTFSVQEEEIIDMIDRCTEILMKQPILIEVAAPVNVCGDIHGQFNDLLRIFNRCGYPPNSIYVFLGDYVDRGEQQLETICLLMGYKVLYPDKFFFLRGNHECASINRSYGFYDECNRRYSINLYNTFQKLFNWMSLCALIGDRILGMHGGISPLLTSWDQLSDDKLKRPLESPPNKSLASDILWSDPDPNATGWQKNNRGVSYVFSARIVREFCRVMNIDLIVRAHQVINDGYEFFAGRKLVTVFSAPKYCGEFNNNAAVMCVDENLKCRFEILKPRTNASRVQAKLPPPEESGSERRASQRRGSQKGSERREGSRKDSRKE